MKKASIKKNTPGGIRMPEGFFSVRETAEKTGYSDTQLRRLDNTGRVKATRLEFGTVEYRAYTQDDIEKLKSLRKDDFVRKIVSLEHQIMDAFSDLYGWEKSSAKHRSLDNKVNEAEKTITISLKFEDEKAIDSLANLFSVKSKGILSREK